MTFRVGPVAAAALVALTLTACGGDTDTPAPSPSPSATSAATASASPTPGTVVGKGAFALTLPKGWVEQSDAGGALLLGLSNQSVNGYPMNVNVIADPTLVDVPPERLAAHRAAILRDAGATNVADRGDYPVDGEPGARLNYRQTYDGIDVVSNEISVAHNDVGYIITISFSPTVGAEQRNTVVDRVMSTWTWAP